MRQSLAIRSKFLQGKYDDDLRWVTLVAKSIQQASEDLEWSECIRLAEKALTERKRGE